MKFSSLFLVSILTSKVNGFVPSRNLNNHEIPVNYQKETLPASSNFNFNQKVKAQVNGEYIPNTIEACKLLQYEPTMHLEHSKLVMKFDQAEIKKAYRQKAKDYHPDSRIKMLKDEGKILSEEQKHMINIEFQRINAAYRVLKFKANQSPEESAKEVVVSSKFGSYRSQAYSDYHTDNDQRVGICLGNTSISPNSFERKVSAHEPPRKKGPVRARDDYSTSNEDRVSLYRTAPQKPVTPKPKAQHVKRTEKHVSRQGPQKMDVSEKRKVNAYSEYNSSIDQNVGKFSVNDEIVEKMLRDQEAKARKMKASSSVEEVTEKLQQEPVVERISPKSPEPLQEEKTSFSYDFKDYTSEQSSYASDEEILQRPNRRVSAFSDYTTSNDQRVGLYGRVGSSS